MTDSKEPGADTSANAKASDAEANASSWLADGNAALEAGNFSRADKCFAKSQYWLDKANELRGLGSLR